MQVKGAGVNTPGSSVGNQDALIDVKMLIMSDTQKRFTITLDADAYTMLRVLALMEDVPVAVVARETIYDRLRKLPGYSREHYDAAMRLVGKDPEEPLSLPEPSKGSATAEGSAGKGSR